MDEINKLPRILIISNNPLDLHSANGKTLESFFKNFPKEKIAQLYFYNALPHSKVCNNFFRITEKNIIKKSLHKMNSSGEIVQEEFEQLKTNIEQLKHNYIPKNNCTRLLRELIWKNGKWKSNELDEWINKIDPDIIFFCAGDSAFAYDITSYIHLQKDRKLITYITDDYIIPCYRNISPFYWIRRHIILKRMRKTVRSSDKFMTISEPMRLKYKELFHKDSFVASNMCECMKMTNIYRPKNNDLEFVYAGGFHYGRYVTLSLLGKALRSYNQKNTEKKAYLKIYSIEKPSKYILKLLNVENGSEYCGTLTYTQLKEVLNTCSFPVHVESFKQKNIYRTKLSVSTKITEYLSLGKCILAIGPKSIASIKLLEDCAFCITSKNSINDSINQLIENDSIQKNLATKAESLYKSVYDSENVRKKFINFLLE